VTNEISVPMRRPDGRWVALADLLALVPGHDLFWSFSDFEGVGGEGPRGESILEFEELVTTSRSGYALSWSELVRFAGQLDQVVNGLLVGARTAPGPERAAGDPRGDAGNVVVIEAFDSTTWEVRATDQELFRRLSKFAADRVD
jgi:hypothetical protein